MRRNDAPHDGKKNENRQLRKLKRSDLLELLLEQTRRNEQLEMENQELRRKLEGQRIAIQKSGSIAEAALRLSGVFEAAQRACETYLRNVVYQNAPKMNAREDKPHE
ncbi:DNA repair protein [Diplocloster agilis]|uniref:DNA repair protein n=1 Tax=Diplocloster agilis TaxID=2850323 RepID=UPI000822AC0B|nr:DNA repair protein [Suonthocola fibrivorans]MCU6736291.1 DNA repair protein [Suonthocola fibrivorans]SCJ88829.1 Uncharacterised protein [uncultured Clostridium sp.]